MSAIFTKRRGGPHALDERLLALREAVELARGRLEDSEVARAEAVVARAGDRLGLGMDITVVALAGPTGAGKSTLFNALAGEELARPGHLRPTTSQATAAVWGEVGDDLLDWLEVSRRHRLSGDRHPMVLLDLPDFDSVQRAHQLEAERVVELADLTVWVVDPQKYADAVLHERYLRPLADYRDSMLVVLNQADRLEPAARADCLTDIARLLTEDGIQGVPTLAVSATTGLGLGELRHLIEQRVSAQEAAASRLSADVTVAGRALAVQCEGPTATVHDADRSALVAALASAAGVPGVVRAAGRAHRRRGALATGWPYVRWVRRLRPDPLRRLRLGDGTGTEHSSLPAPTRVQTAHVESAVRTLASRSASNLPEPWPGLVRAAALSHEGELAGRLEQAVAGADLRMRAPRWWKAVGAVQMLLVVLGLVGALWLLALAGLAYLQLDEVVPTPELEGFPLPTAMLLGGAVAGLLLAILSGIVIRAAARRRARAAGRALEARVRDVADQNVVRPIEAELAALEELNRKLALVQPAPDRTRDGRTRTRGRGAAAP